MLHFELVESYDSLRRGARSGPSCTRARYGLRTDQHVTRGSLLAVLSLMYDFAKPLKMKEKDEKEQHYRNQYARYTEIQSGGVDKLLPRAYGFKAQGRTPSFK